MTVDTAGLLERLPDELRRLVDEYRDPAASESERREAWNLIADCVVANIDEILRSLEDSNG